MRWASALVSGLLVCAACVAQATPVAAQAGAEDKARLRADFMNEFGVARLVRIRQLTGNPHTYDGQTIALRMSFSRMLTGNLALFADEGNMVFVDGVDEEQFPDPDQAFVVAIAVDGTRETTALGGMARFPYSTLVGVYACQEPDCGEFLD